jgi:hypothetical protein
LVSSDRVSGNAISSRTKTFTKCGPYGDVGTEGKKNLLFGLCIRVTLFKLIFAS